MTPKEKKEFDQLKQQVAELMAYKQARERQQLTFPIDLQSQNIIRST